MNHVNLTFHLATRRLIYQNSPFFFSLPPFIAHNGSGEHGENPAELERLWKWFDTRLLPGPGWHAQHQPTKLEFVQGNSFHYTVEKIFASPCLAGASLCPPASTPQTFTQGVPQRAHMAGS